MKQECGCDTGPGKFEGEGAGAALAYWQMGNSDESHAGIDFFKAPLGFDADQEAVAFAKERGYCDDCIAEAAGEECAGASLWESDQGFVYYVTYATAEEYQAAVKEAVEEEDANEQGS